MMIPTLYHRRDDSLWRNRVALANPSEQQAHFFTWLCEAKTSGLLLASAGSGKSTTITNSCSLVPPGFSAVFMAFSKYIVEQLTSKLPQGTEATTFHSLWFKALARSLPRRPKVEAKKVNLILKANLKQKDFMAYANFVSRLVGYAKSVGLGTELLPNDPTEWFRLIDHFGLWSEDVDNDLAVDYAQAALTASNSDVSVIDFDDMLYLPLLRNVSCDRCNFVFVDEAQDLNVVQRTLLRKMLADPARTTSRLIAVGDPHQAIYGFRGADCESMEALQRDFSADVMPLSVSYRCSKAVVAEAQRILAR